MPRWERRTLACRPDDQAPTTACLESLGRLLVVARHHRGAARRHRGAASATGAPPVEIDAGCSSASRPPVDPAQGVAPLRSKLRASPGEDHEPPRRRTCARNHATVWRSCDALGELAWVRAITPQCGALATLRRARRARVGRKTPFPAVRGWKVLIRRTLSPRSSAISWSPTRPGRNGHSRLIPRCFMGRIAYHTPGAGHTSPSARGCADPGTCT
jgi:hypothetical protein